MSRSPSHSFQAMFGASFTETGPGLSAIITTSSKHLQRCLVFIAGKRDGRGLVKEQTISDGERGAARGSSAMKIVILIKTAREFSKPVPPQQDGD